LAYADDACNAILRAKNKRNWRLIGRTGIK